MTNSTTYLSEIHQLLNQHFNLAEIRTLCLDLNVDYESVAGEEKTSRIRELLLGVGRDGRLPELVSLVKGYRPHVDWPPVPNDFELPEALASVESTITKNQHHVYGDMVLGDKISRDKVIFESGAKAVYTGLSIEEVVALAAELKQANQPKVWDGRTPYLGLNSFRERDAPFFFGREILVAELLVRIRQANFITIAGPSGSGKSSVVRAGLFYALSKGAIETSDQWILASMQPQANPFAELALALERATKSTAVGDALRPDKQLTPDLLLRLIQMHLSDDERQRCVLLVDQFEEIFTQTKDTVVQATFINLLTEATQTPNSRFIVVLSLRAEFVSQCARFPDLRVLMNQQFKLVGAMEPQNLAKAITLPALEVGIEIAPALVSRIVTDMKGEPGALPLMSFALRDLFEAERMKKGEPITLTLAGYLQRGGLESALEQHANNVFAAFSDEQKTLARSIFSKLIEVGQGRVYARRKATLQELIFADTSKEAVMAIIKALAQARLITTNSENNDGDLLPEVTTQIIVTLAHERLIDAWPWLRQLVDENIQMIRMQNEIAEAAYKWENYLDVSYLYSGVRLTNVEEQLADNKLLLSESSRVFIEASIARRKVARRRTQMAIGGLIIITLVAILAAILALRATRQATARRMATDARLVAQEGKLRLATLLAIEAIKLDNTDAALIWRDILTTYTPYKEIGILVNHQEQVNSVDWQPAGGRLAYASGGPLNTDNNAVYIWDANHSTQLAVLEGHQAMINHVDWHPSEDRLASASYDNTVRIWDVASGDELVVYEGHTSPVFSVEWHPSGDRLASSSLGQTVHIWNGTNANQLFVLRGHQGAVTSVAWHPDGDRLASASGILPNSDNTIRIWDTASGAELTVLNGHQNGVNSVDWHPDGNRLASASDDGTVRIWDTASGTQIAVLDDHLSGVNSVAWHPDGNHLASASDDGTVRIWDTVTGTELVALRSQPTSVNSVAWRSDGNRLASASGNIPLSDNNAVHIWDVGNSAELVIFEGHGSSVYSVDWHPSGDRLASASLDQTVRIWNAASGDKLATLRSYRDSVENVPWGHSVVWSPEGDNLASASCKDIDDSSHSFPCNQSEIIIWNAANGAEMIVLTVQFAYINNVDWNPDGDRLAAGSSDGIVRIWDIAGGAELAILDGHQGGVNSVDWHSDGNRLAAASSDGTIRIWDVARGVELAVLTGHQNSVNSVDWHPDGNRLASASDDGTVRIWDVARDIEIAVLTGHQDSVNSVDWHPDGNRLASASNDGTVRIWDTKRGAELAIHRGHEYAVYSVVWDTSGERLASASGDVTFQVYNASVGCDRILSNLSLEEWRIFISETIPYHATCPDLPSPGT